MATYSYQTKGGGSATITADNPTAALALLKNQSNADPHSGVQALNVPPPTGSPVGSSAGVLMSSNMQKATGSAVGSLTSPQPTQTPSPTQTTSSAGALTPSAQSYIDTQKTALENEMNTTVSGALSEYQSAASGVDQQVDQQISDLTNQMNTEVEGTKAELLAANPYASEDDPNISGYLDEIKSRYTSQMEAVRSAAAEQKAQLYTTYQTANANARSQFESAFAGIQANAQSMSEAEYKDTLTASKDATTAFMQTANNFAYPANQDVQGMTVGDLFKNYQALFDAAGIDTTQFSDFSNMKVSDLVHLGGTQLSQAAPGDAMSFNGVLSAITQGTAKSTQLQQSQERVDISQQNEALSAERVGIAAERLALAEEKQSGTGGSGLSNAAILKGANNAALSTSEFKKLDADVQNYYSHLSGTSLKNLNSNLTGLRTGTINQKDFEKAVDNMSVSDSVKEYLKQAGQKASDSAPKHEDSSSAISNYWNSFLKSTASILGGGK